MPCNQSLSILNGHVFYSNVFASFLCNHLLEMIGDKYSVCKRNGSWSTYGPVCRKRMLKKSLVLQSQKLIRTKQVSALEPQETDSIGKLIIWGHVQHYDAKMMLKFSPPFQCTFYDRNRASSVNKIKILCVFNEQSPQNMNIMNQTLSP